MGCSKRSRKQVFPLQFKVLSDSYLIPLEKRGRPVLGELNSAKVARNVSGGGWRERAHPCAFMACNIVKNDNSIKRCIYRTGSCHGTWPHVAPSDLYRKVKAIHVTYFISQSNFTGWPLSTQNKNKIAKAISSPKMHKSTRISLRDGGRERDRERVGLSCDSYEYVPQTIHF